jgi:hypothetical protein
MQELKSHTLVYGRGQSPPHNCCSLHCLLVFLRPLSPEYLVPDSLMSLPERGLLSRWLVCCHNPWLRRLFTFTPEFELPKHHHFEHHQHLIHLPTYLPTYLPTPALEHHFEHYLPTELQTSPKHRFAPSPSPRRRTA